MIDQWLRWGQTKWAKSNHARLIFINLPILPHFIIGPITKDDSPFAHRISIAKVLLREVGASNHHFIFKKPICWPVFDTGGPNSTQWRAQRTIHFPTGRSLFFQPYLRISKCRFAEETLVCLQMREIDSEQAYVVMDWSFSGRYPPHDGLLDGNGNLIQ